MIIMNMRTRSIGTQAPSRNLMREAEKLRASMDPKKSRKNIASIILLCQHIMITNDVKQVVTSKTVMTTEHAMTTPNIAKTITLNVENISFHSRQNCSIGNPKYT